MRHKILSLSIFFILLFCTCNKDDSSNNPLPTSDYVPLPLKAGNVWAYLQDDSTVITYTCKDTIINTQALFKFPDDNLWFDVDKDGFYYKDGVLFGLKTYNSSSPAEIAFPKNPIVGQTWRIKDYEMKLEATDEQITVPAGTFSCYKISARETTSVSIKFYSYWSNGKGIIKLWSSATEWREMKSIHLN